MILIANFPHDFDKPLVFPRSISAYQIPIEPLPTYIQHFTAKCNSSFLLAVFCFYGDEFHSLPFADFRRLAAKKALASARNSFSSFSRRISSSCCFTCLRRVFNSSARLIAVCGVCAPPPMSKRPSLAALTHPYSVSTGSPIRPLLSRILFHSIALRPAPYIPCCIFVDSEPSFVASCLSFPIYWPFEFPMSTFIVQHHKYISDTELCTFDIALKNAGVQHKLIPPRTPWHNGKVERSHRNDQRYFYNWEKFASVEDLNRKLKDHLRWSNRKPMRTLGGKSPLDLLREKLSIA